MISIAEGAKKASQSSIPNGGRVTLAVLTIHNDWFLRTA